MREDPELKARLDDLLASFDTIAHRARDPVRFVHAADTYEDRELVGLVAALLAFGNVTAIGRSIERVLSVLGPAPASYLASVQRRRLERQLSTFVHRVYRGPDVVTLLWNAMRVQQRYGSLGDAFFAFREKAPDVHSALSRFADELRGPNATPGLRHLVSDPRKGGASKRLFLYLRWMIRPADGVDLGLWKLSPSELVIPLDTHVHRIARNLGLTARSTANYRTAEEITAVLRSFDPDDPVKYDFAICHLGVSRDCPSRRDESKCNRCALRSVCRVWSLGIH